MSIWYEEKFLVDYRAVDPFGFCRASALLGYLQEAAIHAAEQIGTGREELIEEYHAIWLLARMWYQLKEPIRRDDEITVRTWHRGGRGATMYRDYDIIRDGEVIGEGVSAWVLVDYETRMLKRLSLVSQFLNTDGGEMCKKIALQKLRMPEGLPEAEVRRMGYSEADINGHINNAKYADIACNAIQLERAGRGKFLASLQIGYLAETRPGDVLHLYAGERDGQYFVYGQDQSGQKHFDAVLTLQSRKSWPMGGSFTR
ncbi:hypothetical protein SDC9_52313 [bioreactor metagenome]|uniref:Acyl-ACP thioesterase n=1 Tax=bioreactor metagenome TaxID=1076179 RepID=A0A644WRD0_9ZZZZ